MKICCSYYTPALPPRPLRRKLSGEQMCTDTNKNILCACTVMDNNHWDAWVFIIGNRRTFPSFQNMQSSHSRQCDPAIQSRVPVRNVSRKTESLYPYLASSWHKLVEYVRAVTRTQSVHHFCNTTVDQFSLGPGLEDHSTISHWGRSTPVAIAGDPSEASDFN